MTTRKTSSGNDDLSYRGIKDRIRINVNEAWERNRWAKRFGVTASELQEAVKSVGPLVRNVQVFLAQQRITSKRDPARTGRVNRSRRDPASATTKRGLAQHISREYATKDISIQQLMRDYPLNETQATDIYHLAYNAHGPRGRGTEWFAREIESILSSSSQRDPSRRNTKSVSMAQFSRQRMPREEQRESALFRSEVTRAEKLSLAERKENLAEFARDVKTDPELLAERVSWLLNGSYGHGAYVKAHEVIRNKKLNREAWLVQTVSALEWGVPQRMIAGWWNSLSPSQQTKINILVRKEIRESIGE